MKNASKGSITRGSGNVFQDLGFENSSEYKAKADLAFQVIRTIERRKLTQKKAADLIGATQPDISKLKKGNLTGFTMDRLFSFLLKLDRNIQIQVLKPRSKAKQGVLELVGA
ncbi:MAG: helix-turn-helix transcriptional regulator [Verrucomicrobiota bacterium]